MLKYFKPATSRRTPNVGSLVKMTPTMEEFLHAPTHSSKRRLPNECYETCNHDGDSSNQHGHDCRKYHRPSGKLRTEENHQQLGPFLGLTSRKLSAENLDCDYVKLYSRREASELYGECERELEYFTGELARVQVNGRWHSIPRKQVAHGDCGLTYRYSGVTVPAKTWTPLLEKIRGRLEEVTRQQFNFVLINRYKDGTDYIGEHRDDEKDLVRTSPIASLSLGQTRDFVFRHGESRGKCAKRKLPPIRIELENGSLLMMNYPTNVYWYHSLPVRRKVAGVRINLTFRCLKT